MMSEAKKRLSRKEQLALLAEKDRVDEKLDEEKQRLAEQAREAELDRLYPRVYEFSPETMAEIEHPQRRVIEACNDLADSIEALANCGELEVIGDDGEPLPCQPRELLSPAEVAEIDRICSEHGV